MCRVCCMQLWGERVSSGILLGCKKRLTCSLSYIDAMPSLLQRCRQWTRTMSSSCSACRSACKGTHLSRACPCTLKISHLDTLEDITAAEARQRVLSLQLSL